GRSTRRPSWCRGDWRRSRRRVVDWDWPRRWAPGLAGQWPRPGASLRPLPPTIKERGFSRQDLLVLVRARDSYPGKFARWKVRMQTRAMQLRTSRAAGDRRDANNRGSEHDPANATVFLQKRDSLWHFVKVNSLETPLRSPKLAESPCRPQFRSTHATRLRFGDSPRSTAGGSAGVRGGRGVRVRGIDVLAAGAGRTPLRRRQPLEASDSGGVDHRRECREYVYRPRSGVADGGELGPGEERVAGADCRG